MPYGKSKSYRKTPRSYSRKRTTTRRRTNSKRTYASVPKNRTIWKNPLPTAGFYKLKYQDSNFNGTCTSAAPLTQVFRGNSLFDPDFTGGGVQPYGFDQLCAANAPFGAYVVYSSKIKIFPHINSSLAYSFQPIRMVVAPCRENSLTYTEFEDICQIPGHRAITINTLDTAKSVLSAFCKTKTILQQPPVSSQTIALYNADPGRPWFWIYYVEPITSADVAMRYDVQITYYCKLIRNQDVNES